MKTQSTAKICVPLGTARGATVQTNNQAFVNNKGNTTYFTWISSCVSSTCTAYNSNACAAQATAYAAGTSKLVASAAVAATAVYMM